MRRESVAHFGGEAGMCLLRAGDVAGFFGYQEYTSVASRLAGITKSTRHFSATGEMRNAVSHSIRQAELSDWRK